MLQTTSSDSRALEKGQPRVRRRCVIMDNSVVDDTGHHLEYARRVAAGLRGTAEVVLLANRAYVGASVQDMRVERAFTQTFWEQYRPRGGPVAWARKTVRGWRDSWARTRDRFYFRHFALYLERLKSTPTFRSAEVGSYASGARPNATPFLVFVAGHMLRVVRRRILNDLGAVKNILRAVLARLRLLGAARMGMRILRRLFGYAARIVLLVLALPFVLIAAPLLLIVRALSRGRSLSGELRTALQRLRFNKDDVLFVPTAGAAELDAVLAWLDRSEQGRSVRILFRREIWLPGDIAKFALDSPRTREIKTRLATLADLHRHDVRLLVDTDALAEQYQALTTLPVDVLPLPSRPIDMPGARTAPEPNDEALVISLGDARTEKGFHFLPEMAHASLSEPSLRARFMLQANVHADNREEEVFAALAMLASETFQRITLLREALDPEQYAQLLSRADVVLAPYNPRAYGARSSGVFAEALAAGKPVVSTAGSWMDQVATQYVGDLLQTAWRDARDAASSAEAAPALLAKATPELPLPPERRHGALFDLVRGLRVQLSQGVGERTGATPFAIGSADGVIYLYAAAEIASAPGFTENLRLAARGARLKLQARRIEPADAPRDLCAGVRIAEANPRALAAALRHLLLDLPSAQRDASRAQQLLEWVWSDRTIATVLMNRAGALQGAAA